MASTFHLMLGVEYCFSIVNRQSSIVNSLEWRRVISDNLPIEHMHRACGVGAHTRVVRHNDDGMSSLVEPLDDLHDLRTRACIQVAGRLITNKSWAG